MHKIYIISDEIRDNHPEFKNQKWICDILKTEFSQRFNDIVTTNELDATIIWYLAPWNFKYTPKSLSREKWLELLENKKVIFTQHHIDNLKMDQLQTQFNFMKKYGNHIHAICNNTYEELKIHFENISISKKKLWINSKNFFEIKNKNSIREKYKIDKNSYLIGSFQKDTEGKSDLPKLSKGPDIFVNIIEDMYKNNKNIVVVLTGLRREFIINKLNILNIPYHYFNMISIEDINELYNCLDLYLVSSRCEGGPRSIFECGLTNTPIISTNVGIASELMNKNSIFDADNYITYKNVVPDNKFLKNNVELLSSTEYFNEFKEYIINC
jgi:hypothetical protein